MALRQLASRTGLWRTAAEHAVRWQSAAAAATPTVYDKMVQVTVIDKAGRRHPVRGLAGQTLVQALEQQDALDVSDYLCLSPEGRGEWELVVSVPNEFTTRIPAPGEDDVKSLEQIAERAITSNTRLGSKIVLNKDLNQMLVALGEAYPWKTL